jgi:hypothetical protein
VTLTTPVATATVAVPPPPTVTTVPTVTATTPVATATVALPPPPPPVQTVVSAVTTAAAPVTTTAAAVTGAAAGAAASAPSAPSASSAQPTGGAATAPSPAAGVAGATPTFAAAPTGSQVRTAPTLRTRATPGRVGARRLVLTLARPRELTVLFRGPGETCRVAGRMVVHGKRGRNVVPLNGRVRGGRLAPGMFRVEVLDTTGSAQRVVGKLAVMLRYDARGRAQVRQVRYVPRDCALGVAALLTSSRLVAGERATPARPAAQQQDARPTPAQPTVDVRGEDDDEGGGLAALPNLAPADAVGGLAAAILIGLLVLSAGGFLLVAGGSAYRRLRG